MMRSPPAERQQDPTVLTSAFNAVDGQLRAELVEFGLRGFELLNDGLQGRAKVLVVRVHRGLVPRDGKVVPTAFGHGQLLSLTYHRIKYGTEKVGLSRCRTRSPASSLENNKRPLKAAC